MRPSLATDRISLGFWLNIRFVVNHRGAFRSIITFVIDLLTSEDRYFLWITAVPLPRWCLQFPTTFGIAHAPCCTRAERATQSAGWVGSSLFDFLTVPSTHYVPKIVFTFSPICRAFKNSIAIYLIIMRDLIFTRGQFWPSGIVVACVCPCVRQSWAYQRDNSSQLPA